MDPITMLYFLISFMIVAVIVAVPRTVMDAGLGVTVTLAGGGAVIATVAEADIVEYVAVTVTDVGVFAAVRVTDA